MECCVCSSSNCTITMCNHSICEACLTKLDGLKCPMCRSTGDAFLTNELKEILQDDFSKKLFTLFKDLTPKFKVYEMQENEIVDYTFEVKIKRGGNKIMYSSSTFNTVGDYSDNDDTDSD